MQNDSKRYQINHDGTLVLRETKLCRNHNEMLNKLFSQFGWNCNITNQTGSRKELSLQNSAGEKYKLIVYSGSVRDESRSPCEMKIQLGSNIDPRTENRKQTLILGIYIFEENDTIEDAIFLGYPIKNDVNYPKNPSLRGAFVNRILINAKQNGFVYDKDNNMVGFRSQFIYYYLKNFYHLHYGTTNETETKTMNIVDKIGGLSENNNKDFIFDWLNFMKEAKLLTDTNVALMCNAKHCKTLGHAVPILKPYDAKKGKKQFKDSRGNLRYYNSENRLYIINNKKYCVTKQWYRDETLGNNCQKFMDWGKSLIKSPQNVVGHIKHYMKTKGFEYSDDTVENLYLSLKTKPFVILAGRSGTGKSKLVKLFAEAIDAKYDIIHIRHNWSSLSDLLGYTDSNGKFVSSKMLDFIKEAENNHNTPYILCLDEMNLARVEYYFSDFLSVIETRELQDGKITTKPLIEKKDFGTDIDQFEKYGELQFPENLYIIGTINMDETTFPLSRKVLDRANTIEFNEIKLTPLFAKANVEKLPQSNNFLKAKYVTLADCDKNPLLERTCETLENINKILETSNAYIGYRARDEIVFYMLNNAESDLLTEDNAMDNAIMQKILPHIQGSSISVKKLLEGFVKICKGKYPKCENKIAFMLKRFAEDGFTTYWR